jgi:DNA invertase Pin-like site-specific DNA recombinase
MEREKIRERTLAGLARARKQGRIGGRPKATEDYKLVQQVESLRSKGESIRKIAATVGASLQPCRSYSVSRRRDDTSKTAWPFTGATPV